MRLRPAGQVDVVAVQPDLDLRRGRLDLAVATGVVLVPVGVDQIVEIGPAEPQLAQGRLDRCARRVRRPAVDQRQLLAPHQVQVDRVAGIRRLDPNDSLAYVLHPVSQSIRTP